MIRTVHLKFILIALALKTITFVDAAALFDFPWVRNAVPEVKKSSESLTNEDKFKRVDHHINLSESSQDNSKLSMASSKYSFRPTPSKPIRIPATPEKFKIMQSELNGFDENLKGVKEFKEKSISEISSPASSFEEPMMFEMSYSGRQALEEKLKKIFKKHRKQLKKQEIEENRIKNIQMSTSPDFDFFCTGESDLESEENLMVERFKKYASNRISESDDPNIESDSDFGSQTKKECWSLSY
jgi:hypothetical protein